MRLSRGRIWQSIFIGILVMGVIFRLSHLDRKVYWHDEVYTSLRVSGYQGPQVEQQVFTGEILTAQALLQYQTFAPGATFGDTLSSLANNPEHSPLYYVLAYGWGKVFGPSVAGFRGLAAWGSVLALPLMFWLCRLLFHDTLIAWVAMGLLALSPVQLIYAQEAREYSLWIAASLLASITLLQALRDPKPGKWLAYGLSLGLSFYAALLTVLVVIAHGLFVIWTQKPRQWGAFMLAVAAGLVSFLPWIVVLVVNWQRFQHVTAWTKEARPWDFLMKLWGLHYSSAVIDLGLSLDHPYTYLVPPVVLLLMGLSLTALHRHFPGEPFRFVLCLLLVPPVLLIGADWIRGGQISGSTRYFLSSLVAALISLAAWIGIGLQAPVQSRRIWATALLGVLIFSSALSCGLNLQARTWWNKGISYGNPAIADRINQADRPLLLGTFNATALGNVISLSYRLRPDTALRLAKETSPPPADWPGSIFLYRPDPEALEEIPLGQ